MSEMNIVASSFPDNNKNDVVFAIDDLPPAIRKACRNTNDPNADVKAAKWLAQGYSEERILRALQKAFDPISADRKPNFEIEG